MLLFLFLLEGPDQKWLPIKVTYPNVWRMEFRNDYPLELMPQIFVLSEHPEK